jgi:hypothetical protein
MWMESTEWKNKNDIIKPMTQKMKDQKQAQSAAAQAQSKAAVATAQTNQKFQQKQQLQSQQTDDRIKRDLVVNAFRDNSESESAEGLPSAGGIGGQQAQLDDACGTVIDGGLAVQGSTVYLPCLNGPVAVQTTDSPAGIHLLWSSSVGGGPPIVAGGLVWTIGSNGVLYGLNPTSGALQDQATIGAPANHFPTPSVGAGLLLAPSSDRVVAFRATSSGPVPARTTTTSGPSITKPTAAPVEQPSGTSPWVIAAAIGGVIVVLGLVTWLIRRRRGRGTAPDGS